MNKITVAICAWALLSSIVVRAEFDPSQQLQQPEATQYGNPTQGEQNYQQQQQVQQQQQQPQQYQQQQQQAQQPQQPQQYQQQQQQVQQQPGKPQKQVFTNKDKEKIISDPSTLLTLTEEERKQAIKDGAFNFTDEDAYMDVEDAMQSKQFIHRHILSKTAHDAQTLKLGRYFINLLTTNSYVHQEGDPVIAKWIEYVAGGMTLSGGFTTESRHTFELGMSLSSISFVFAGYRRLFGTPDWDVWPYAGGGFGLGMSFLDISDGPFEVQTYAAGNTVLSAVGGIMLPLPDIAVKFEIRIDLWGGTTRMVFTPGFGVIFYM